MNKKGAHFGIVLSAIGIVILVFIAGFWYSGSGEGEILDYEEASEFKPELEIIELNLCSNVDEDYNCEEDEDGVFDREESVYVWFIAAGLEEKEGKISYKQELEIRGPDGNIIPEVSGIWIEEQKEYSENVAFYNEITSDMSDKIGSYRFNIIITDKNNDKKTSKPGRFTLS